jgi:hypothetical protein
MSQKTPSTTDTKSGPHDDKLSHTSTALCPAYSLTTSWFSAHHWWGSSDRFSSRRLRTGSLGRARFFSGRRAASVIAGGVSGVVVLGTALTRRPRLIEVASDTVVVSIL